MSLFEWLSVLATSRPSEDTTPTAPWPLLPGEAPTRVRSPTTITLRPVEIVRCTENERVVFSGKGRKSVRRAAASCKRPKKLFFWGMRKTLDSAGSSGLLHQARAQTRGQLVPRSQQQAATQTNPSKKPPPARALTLIAGRSARCFCPAHPGRARSTPPRDTRT